MTVWSGMTVWDSGRRMWLRMTDEVWDDGKGMGSRNKFGITVWVMGDKKKKILKY